MIYKYKVWRMPGRKDKVLYISPADDPVEKQYLNLWQQQGIVEYVGTFETDMYFEDNERYFGYVKTHTNQSGLHRLLLSLSSRNIDFT